MSNLIKLNIIQTGIFLLNQNSWLKLWYSDYSTYRMAYNLRKRKPLLTEEKSATDSDSDFETDTDEGKIFH